MSPQQKEATAPTPRPVPRTATREVRRRQLIMAAMDSIAQRGFSDTTLRHVTENAKLSHGVVNYHFDSKEALYDAILEYLAKEHYQLWRRNLDAAGDDPAARLTAIVKADFDRKICTPKKMAVWFAFWGQAKYRPNYLKIHNIYDEERSREIIRICTALAGPGDADGKGAEATAHAIEAMIDGLWLSMLLYPAGTTAAGCHRDCMQAISRMFPGRFDDDMDAAPSHGR